MLKFPHDNTFLLLGIGDELRWRLLEIPPPLYSMCLNLQFNCNALLTCSYMFYLANMRLHILIARYILQIQVNPQIQ